MLFRSGARYTASQFARIGHKPVFQTRIVVGSDKTHTRFWVGITSSDVASGNHKTSLPASSLWLTCDVESGDTNWMLRAKDATTQSTDIDTGVAYTADHEYVVTLQVESSTTVRWQIEDVTAVTVTSALSTPSKMPAAAASLSPNVYGFTVDNVAKHVYINAMLYTSLPYP